MVAARSQRSRSRRLRNWLAAPILLLSLAFVLGAASHSDVQNSASSSGWASNWHRTSGAPAGLTYVGSARCAECHRSIANIQAGTDMALAATVPNQTYPGGTSALTFRDGPYELQMARQKDAVVYSVTDGKTTLSVPLLWSFGRGYAGQTYIFQHDGTYYESRLSYYSDLKGLDITMGHSRQAPQSLLAALGRPLASGEVSKCFSCHTSEDLFESKLDLSRVHPGITCENCHGPGSEHVQAMKNPGATSLDTAAIFNPGSLAPADLNDFCGTCHRSTHDVLAANIKDIRNIRFQPYRLENSPCYDPSDKRITCIACHDPHANLDRSAASYDAKCLACHANRGEVRTSMQTAPACPRQTKECVTCHMTKRLLPGTHHEFTDHYIRVSQPGEPYPG